jgi:hypothetical protein
MKVQYYTKDGCPLCDEGLAILYTFAGLEIEVIDIEEDPDIHSAFARRIPVVRRAMHTAELGWPFDRQDVERFLFEV